MCLIYTNAVIEKYTLFLLSKSNIKSPLLGSLAKACTETRTPDLTKKVPKRLKEKVKILKSNVHVINSPFFFNYNN